MQTVSRLIDSFTPSAYELTLTLFREERRFEGIVKIRGIAYNQNELRLHAKDLAIVQASINDNVLAVTHEADDELVLSGDIITTSDCLVEIVFTGEITDQMHGLYPCYFTHEGSKKELLATQFESHHAREVFPCIDEPEAKATFDLTLNTEQNVEILGNMPIASQFPKENRLVTSFEKSPRMSSYLLAWVVGELHKKTAYSKSGVEVNVWATPAQSSSSLDFALDIATRSIDFYDDYFGTPYPLPKADHVALPDFSSGAMENWGLITYREAALLVDPQTTSVSAKHYIATVIAHELAHQWFGNLVTMRWWNNLWLNESFATLMEYIAIDALQPDWNVWLDFSANESVMALRRDAIDGVQSVQVDVHHPDEISTLFDGAIVYAKGARLLRMLEVYVGKDAFRAGLRDYFNTHAYTNTEAEDLWNALSKTSGKDIANFMGAWISQSGYPVVSLDNDTISQKQFFIGEHQPNTKSWPIPLGSSNSSLPELLDTPEQSIVDVALTARLNQDDSAHFITHYSMKRLTSIIDSINDASPISRLQLLNEQILLARAGTVSSATLPRLIYAYRHETIESVWDIISLAISELKKFVEEDQDAEQALRKLSGILAKPLYESLGWEQNDNEPETYTKLRATIIGLMLFSEEPKVIREALTRYDNAPEIATLPGELRSLILGTVVKHRESEKLIDTLLSYYAATASVDLKQDITLGLSATKNPETVKRLLDASKDVQIVKTQDAFRWFVYLIRSKYGRQVSWQWLMDNWPWIVKTFSGDKSYDDYPRYAASGLTSKTELAAYRDFFTPMKEEPALARTIDLGLLEIASRVDQLERDTSAVQSSLLDLDI